MIRAALNGDDVADIFFDVTRNRFDIRVLAPVSQGDTLMGLVSNNFAIDDRFSTALRSKYRFDVMFFIVIDDENNVPDLVGSTIEEEIEWHTLQIATRTGPIYKNAVNISGVRGSLYSLPIKDTDEHAGAVIVMISNNDLLYSMQRQLLAIIAAILIVNVAVHECRY